MPEILLKSGEKYTLCHEVGNTDKEESRERCNLNSDNLVAFPASWLWVLKAFAGVRLLRVLVLAHERVGVLFLIEITKGMVDFAVLTLICANCCALAWIILEIYGILTVEKQIAHRPVTLGHLPIVDGNLRGL
jgi:hypothetical protein